MKGGFRGLKISQVSLVLIGFVCITVLALTWTKTTVLSSLFPLQYTGSTRVLQLDHGENFAGNNSLHTESEQVESTASRPIDPAVKGGNNKNLTSTTRTEEISEAKIKSKQAEAGLEEPGVALTTESSVNIKQMRNSSASARKKDCNYSKGKWIFDERLPLYSGFGCKQWLSSMWACRLTQRTDFEYEKLRWQPKNCEKEVFTSSKFLERMQHKTLAFIGDSLGRQQFQSLMCMTTSGEERPDVLDVGYEYGLVKARGAVRPDGWAYRFPSTNTTILYYWSSSLCELDPLNVSNPVTDFAMHLDRPPAFLHRYFHKFDVIVLNTGHHWNRGKFTANRWIMYVGGKPNTDRDIVRAKNITLHSITRWMDSQLQKFPGKKAFFRTLSPRHFFNGDWNTGGTCDNTVPLMLGGMEVTQNEPSDPVTASAVAGTNVKLLDITALSQLRDEGHISRYSIKATPGVQDCLHWCLPGVPDTWNEILFAQI